MKIRLLPIALLSTSAAVAAPTALPEFVQSYLGAEAINYELPHGRFEPYLQSYFDGEGLAEPWSISGDFNGDNTIDWAGLLRNEMGQLEVVVIYSVCDEYSHQVLSSFGVDDDRIYFGVELKLPGKIYGFPTDDNRDPVVYLRNLGIHIVYYEKSSVLHYWDNGTFNEMWTSD